MGVAAHLGIELAQYDRRIRTFIPDYEAMLTAVAEEVPSDTRTIVELGIGTGALAARCLERAPRARVIGLDADPAILALAARRLRSAATLHNVNFVRAPLPAAGVVVASFALHHVRTKAAKSGLYRRVHRALRPGGVFLSADCYPASNPARRADQRQAWKSHLRAFYGSAKADALLRAWSHEDVHFPLDEELDLLRRAGFSVDVSWRRDSFAVIAGLRTPARTNAARRRRLREN